MEYTIELSDYGLRRQFGKIPTESEMAYILTQALSSHVFEKRILNGGDYPIQKSRAKRSPNKRSARLPKPMFKNEACGRVSPD